MVPIKTVRYIHFLPLMRRKLSLSFKAHCASRITYYNCCRSFCSPSASDALLPEEDPTLVSTAPYKVMFFGSDEFSLASLKRLSTRSDLVSNLEVTVKSLSHPSPVSQFALEEGFTLHEWPPNLTSRQFDLGIVVSFGKLIPEDTILRFPWGILNVHGSILPQYRGAAPVARTILNGDTTAGVSIMAIEPHRFDVGAILLTATIDVSLDDTTNSLTSKLALVGAETLVEVLEDLPKHLRKRVPQNEEFASKAPKLQKADGLLDFSSMTADEVDQRFRAVHETYPVMATWHGQLVKFLDIKSVARLHPHITPPASQTIVVPGSVSYDYPRGLIWVKCKCGNSVAISSLAVKGKKPQTAKDFHNGYLSKVSRELWKFDVVSVVSTTKKRQIT